MIFKHVNSAKQFVDQWKQHIQPYIAPITGVYTPQTSNESTRNLSCNQISDTSQDPGTSFSCDESLSSEPSAKKRRIHSEDASKDIDFIIAEKFIGKCIHIRVRSKIRTFNLSVACFHALLQSLCAT